MAADQKRYEVFLSSTYADLREARQGVTMTLLECDAFPTGMEIFPATDDDAWTLICRIIDECDYYLLVIAGKYGSVNPTTGLSYTEMEYDYAVSAGKPVMAFLHGDLGALRADQSETTEELRTKLENFRQKVQKAKHVKYWKSPEELAGHVARTYNRFVRSYPAVGWVRTDQASSTESLKELLDAKAKIDELQTALIKAEASAPAGTEYLSQGGDKFTAEYRFSAYTQASATGHLQSVGEWIYQRPSWDELFAAIAPKLLQEAEEGDLQAAINTFLFEEYLDDNVRGLITRAESVVKVRAGKTLTQNDFRNWKTEISDENFGTILVQLRALGLIQKSERKRSVSDTGTYWALTPYGEIRTIQLRAIKKGDDIPGVPRSDTEEGDS